MAPRLDVDWTMAAGGLAFDADVKRAGALPGGPPRGVFGEFPGVTPKYALNDGTGEQSDFREQMARMFIQVKDYTAFLKTFETNPGTHKIAKVIGGSISEDGKTNRSEGNGYIDFLLQSVQHGFQEKNQVVETLADDHVAYFFGQSAPIFNYGGTLINTKQDDQAMNMLRMYRDMGRGSKLAQLNALLSIRYDGLIVSGVMMNLSWSLSAEMETAVPFSFSLLVKDIVHLQNVYGTVVALETEFATIENTGGQYLPFATGLGNLNTAAVKITMLPPVASALTPPTAPAEQKEEAEVSERSKVRAAMRENATAKTNAEFEKLIRPPGGARILIR